MNRRSLLACICVLFLVGIVWMIAVAPKGEISKADVTLFKPVEPSGEEIVVAPRPAESSEHEKTTPSREESPQPSEGKESAGVESEPAPAQVASDEPPEVTEYTPTYGQVTFTHLKHLEDYEIDCAACHHENLEGGMSRCTNCHEPPKEIFHKNCQGCHKELKGEGKKTGPVGCRECHIKEAPEPVEPPKQEETAASKEEVPQPSEEKESAGVESEPEPAQAASDEPPEVAEYTSKYGKVTFTHMMHVEDYGIDCAACHHENLEGGMSRCTNCHEPPKEFFHKNCQGCHKELKGEGKETGPVKCRDCHVKETS